MNNNYLPNVLERKRAVRLRSGQIDKAVLCWMNRDQRINDNHALSFAQALAIEYHQPLIVFYGFDNTAERHNLVQLAFCIDGLKQLETKLHQLKIPLITRVGSLPDELRETIDKNEIGTVVTDFSPLREDKRILEDVKERSSAGLYLVDSHNIVPVWVASDKREYAAYTIRPRITRLLSDYRDPAPEIVKHRFRIVRESSRLDWPQIVKKLGVEPISTRFDSGEDAANNTLDRFVSGKLPTYAERRNDPNENNQSNLSPYLHFGQISSRTVLERAQQAIEPCDSLDQFIDEIVVRKELSDNFCYFEENYDKTSAFPDWAKKTLSEHRHDPREFLYSLEEFEQGTTHDPLWNAAQKEMITTGKMHGYLRMYWAKKILEWSPSIEPAMETAIHLNDKYQLDGHDPNGYAGIAWSIGGVHDRAWFERDIFGKVRYMSYKGCQRKFDIKQYISRADLTPTNTRSPEMIEKE